MKKLFCDGGFTFGAWEGPRKFVLQNTEDMRYRFREMRECGINTLFLFAELADSDWLDMTVSAAEQEDIRLAVDLGAVWRDREKLDRTLDATSKSPAVVAYNVVDEPPLAWFDELSPVIKYVKSRFPDKTVFTNLNPLYAPPAYLGESENGRTPYFCYLDKFVRTANPDCLSFDYYPYVGNYEANEKMRLSMLENLSNIREISDKYRIRFCGFTQASRWGRYEGGEWRGTKIPTLGEYRFLTNIHLAFGASMLTDFLYWSRTGTRPEQRMPGVFDGIMSENGDRTPLFEISKTVKAEVSENAFLIADSEFAGIITAGLTHDELNALGGVVRSDFDGLRLESSGKIIAGCFVNQNKSFIYAVNYSDNTPAVFSFNNQNRTLAPGGGMIAEK